jgi:molecular chaperone HscA
MRDAFMVVDAGAGTTDFGLFISRKKSEDDEPRIFQIFESVKGIKQAGDKVDNLLRGFIAQKESIDSSDNPNKLILADLTRRIRSFKEVLFKTGELEYTLSDDTVGRIRLDDFLADEKVTRFHQAVENGFKEALEAVDESWLHWLAMDGVRLHVVLTGGSSTLPMIQTLGKGLIVVKDNYRILRELVDSKPGWMDDMPDELLTVYPQLAVAIGGSAETIPETYDGPPIFAGGMRGPSYVAGNIHVGGK